MAKRRLAHRRPRRNDHQIRSLQSAGHLVEIGVVRGQSSNPLAALQQRIDRPERLAHNLLHAHEAAPDALFRELKDRSLGVAEHFLRRIGLIAARAIAVFAA
jgi:hypothetical protein